MALPKMCTPRPLLSVVVVLLPGEGEKKYRDNLTGCTLHSSSSPGLWLDPVNLCRLERDSGGLWSGLIISNYEHLGDT